MISRKELVKALRCSASAKRQSCKGCPYRLLEEVTDGLEVAIGVQINGKAYWESCDTEKMVMDAANMLEKNLEAIEK